MKISIVVLLPMFLMITEQELGVVPVIADIPLVTLPAIGFLIVFVYGLLQEDEMNALKMVVIAGVLLTIPIALSVLIQGGGIQDLAQALLSAVFAMTF